jgi:hypothetical protein
MIGLGSPRCLTPDGRASAPQLESRRACVSVLGDLRLFRVLRLQRRMNKRPVEIRKRVTKHAVVRWNPATQEHFCVACGKTSDAISIADAQERLEQYDCNVPSIDVTMPEPGTETMRLKSKKEITARLNRLLRPIFAIPFDTLSAWHSGQCRCRADLRPSTIRSGSLS